MVRELAYTQTAKADEGASEVDIWRRPVPGGRNNRSKDPEAGVGLANLRPRR